MLRQAFFPQYDLKQDSDGFRISARGLPRWAIGRFARFREEALRCFFSFCATGDFRLDSKGSFIAEQVEDPLPGKATR